MFAPPQPSAAIYRLDRLQYCRPGLLGYPKVRRPNRDAEIEPFHREGRREQHPRGIYFSADVFDQEDNTKRRQSLWPARLVIEDILAISLVDTGDECKRLAVNHLTCRDLLTEFRVVGPNDLRRSRRVRAEQHQSVARHLSDGALPGLYE
ncbi:hypothetical protein [Mesorhizobium sp.]|uniref:hypothetical protein n=1 Tax=Mesorhizobium sp. TaxID=1871066 RepID=UPI00345B9476